MAKATIVVSGSYLKVSTIEVIIGTFAWSMYFHGICTDNFTYLMEYPNLFTTCIDKLQGGMLIEWNKKENLK